MVGNHRWVDGEGIMYVRYESHIFRVNNLKLNLLARAFMSYGNGRRRGFGNTSPAIIEYDLRAKLDSLKHVIKMRMEMIELR